MGAWHDGSRLSFVVYHSRDKGFAGRELVMPLPRALSLSLTLKWHEAKKLSRDPEGQEIDDSD